jgi:thymidylate synthase (FAD)
MNLIEPSAEILTDINNTRALKQIEQAARNCYRSEDRITEDGESAKKIVKMLMSKHHNAMLEFVDITVRLVCDIGVYKDLTRHRHCSFAIESTRYCNYKDGIHFIKPCNMYEGTTAYELWLLTMEYIDNAYQRMAQAGAKPDQLRMMLPHSTAASVVMKANVREWRHIFELRTSTAAHPSVQQVMNMLLKEFKQKLPDLFGDL